MTSVFTPLSFAKDKKSDQKISFNFVNVEIPTLIKFISKITGNNFIFDERIRGKITIIGPTKLSIDESFTLFTSILNLKGYTIIPAGTKTYKIIPSSEAKQTGEISTGEKMPVNERFITKLLIVEHIKAEDALGFLRPVVSRNGHISVFGPRNLLLIVDSAVNIEKIALILKQIDQPPTHEEPAKINVYFLKHANATDLAKVLKGIIKSARASKKSVAQGKKTSLLDSVARISITPDKATNSLIIVAPPSDYQNIVQVIKSLDKRKKQVFVEVTIIEASIEKLRELGTKWRAIAKHQGDPIVIGGFGNISSGAIQGIINGLTGFTAGGMGNFLTVPLTTIGSDGTITSANLTAPGFAVLFSLSDFKDVINVLSTPQILTSDNEEAEIIVGENVPFISKRERDITTTNTVLSSIERKDVGITLRITPQITEGDYVNLDIYQEISALKETTENILTTIGPSTTKRSTKTSVVIKDGQTVVIGGLMQEREEEGIAKTPLLGDIPVLGWLFKYKTVRKTKTNLLVFLTPHVIKESSQLTMLSKAKHRVFAMREKHYKESELMVKFKAHVSMDRAMEIISQKGASVLKYFENIGVYHLKLKPEQEVEDAVKEFSSIPEVFYAEPNFKVKIQDNPFQENNPEKIDRKDKEQDLPDGSQDSLINPDSSSNKNDTPNRVYGPMRPFLSGLDRR